MSEFLRGHLGEYLAVFAALFLSGVGLPLPEEVTLLGSGVFVHRGEAEFWPIVIVCSLAILLGDSVPYALGRRYGMSALRVKWVSRVLHPERFAQFESRYRRHGNWATFLCRFFPGIRIPGYFLAGTMGMGYLRFLLLDLLGVAISVPISVHLGRLFADSIDELKSNVTDLHLILGFTVLALLLFIVVRSRARKRTPPGPDRKT